MEPTLSFTNKNISSLFLDIYQKPVFLQLFILCHNQVLSALSKYAFGLVSISVLARLPFKKTEENPISYGVKTYSFILKTSMSFSLTVLRTIQQIVKYSTHMEPLFLKVNNSESVSQ